MLKVLLLLTVNFSAFLFKQFVVQATEINLEEVYCLLLFLILCLRTYILHFSSNKWTLLIAGEVTSEMKTLRPMVFRGNIPKKMRLAPKITYLENAQ